jgi:hypothetical protein
MLAGRALGRDMVGRHVKYGSPPGELIPVGLAASGSADAGVGGML